MLLLHTKLGTQPAVTHTHTHTNTHTHFSVVSLCSNVEAFLNGVEHSALEHSMKMAQSPNQAPYIRQV